MNDRELRFINDLRICGSVPARAARLKAAGLGLFNLYISQYRPFRTSVYNRDNLYDGIGQYQPQMEYIFNPTGVYFWKLFHILFLLPIIYQKAIFRKFMWPAIIILTLWLTVYAENCIMMGYELYHTLGAQEFQRLCAFIAQSIGGIGVELILILGSLEYYDHLTGL